LIDFRSADRWENLDGFVERELEKLVPIAMRAVKRSALYLEGEVKRTLSGSRSGRSYKVSRTGRLHIASAPGEPPAVLMGVLRNSVVHSEPVREGDRIFSNVGPGAGQDEADIPPYAVRLEFGGIDSRGVMIEARPYMTPTAERARSVIEQQLHQAMQETPR
jgi:hypothetical protein